MESAEDVSQRLLEALLALELSLTRYRALVARRFGVAVQDLALLSILARAGGRSTPRELSIGLHMSSGTLTNMLDRVARAGLVERRPNPQDRRSVLVVMTPAGRSAAAVLHRGLHEALAEALPAPSRATFAGALPALAAAVDARTGGLAAGPAAG